MTRLQRLENNIRKLSKMLSCNVRFFDNLAAFPEVGKECVLYIDKENVTIHIWNGTEYVTFGGGGAVDISGQFIGSSNTFAGLPTPPEASSGDWAALTAEDGVNLPGIYVYNGTIFSFVIQIADPFTLDASAFSGNLTTTDDSLQKVADKFDAFKEPSAIVATIIPPTAYLGSEDTNFNAIVEFNVASNWEIGDYLQVFIPAANLVDFDGAATYVFVGNTQYSVDNTSYSAIATGGGVLLTVTTQTGVIGMNYNYNLSSSKDLTYTFIHKDVSNTTKNTVSFSKEVLEIRGNLNKYSLVTAPAPFNTLVKAPILTEAQRDAALLTDVSTDHGKIIYNNDTKFLEYWNGTGWVSGNIVPITAATASALTPVEGMDVFVSDTDATFTDIGRWSYSNGSWSYMESVGGAATINGVLAKTYSAEFQKKGKLLDIAPPVSGSRPHVQGADADWQYLYTVADENIRRYNLNDLTTYIENLTPHLDGTNVDQVNVPFVMDDVLYVGSSNYPNAPAVSYIKRYSTSTLTYLGEQLVGPGGSGAAYSEGATFSGGYWWATYFDVAVVSKYDENWLWVEDYSLDATRNSQGGRFHNGLFYRSVTPTIPNGITMEVYSFEGNDFTLELEIKMPEYPSNQGFGIGADGVIYMGSFDATIPASKKSNIVVYSLDAYVNYDLVEDIVLKQSFTNSNGIDSRIEIPYAADITFGNGGASDSPYSFSIWIFNNISSTGNTQHLFYKGDAGLAQYEIFFKLQNEQLSLVNYGSSTASNIKVITSGGEVTLNAWTHVVGTYDGTDSQNGLNIYVDGLLMGVTRTTGGTYNGLANHTIPINIGALKGLTTNNFRGHMHDAIVWNKELSGAEVTSLFNTCDIPSLPFYSDALRHFPLNGDAVDSKGIEDAIEVSASYTAVNKCN